MWARRVRNNRKPFISVCQYKYYFYPRQRTLPDPCRDARKVFREVRASKQDQTCSEFRAVLNSLKSHYNKIPPKLLVDFVPRLLSRTAESLRWRVWRRKKGRKFHLARKREEKTIRGLGARDRRAGKSDGPRKIPRRYYTSTYRPRRIMVTSCRDFQLPSKWKLHARRSQETKMRPVLIRFAIMAGQLIIAVEIKLERFLRGI